MAQMVLKFNTSDVTRSVGQLKARFPNAIRRALNRAATSTKAVMASEIAKDTGLKVGTVKDQIHVQEATVTNFVARLSISGAPIPLYDFNAKGRLPSRGKGAGVRAKLPPPGKGTYPNAFLARMKSGHIGVFQRTGKARLPIYELHGPSLPKVFTKYIHVGLARGEESLRKNLQSELRFAANVAAA